MRETLTPPEYRENKRWGDYTVAVMGSSSDRNTEAVANGREIGKILAEMHINVSNGGYAAGSMGATAESFKAACKEQGMSDDEIAGHFNAVVFSEDAVGHVMTEKRIKTAAVREYDNLTNRLGGLINGSDAIIILSGGVGTITEAYTSGIDEGFRQRKSKQSQNRLPIRPMIVIDSGNLVVKQMALAEAEASGTIGGIADDVFVLAGHKKENGVTATLENDPQMREELKMILEYYQLIKEGRNAVDADPQAKKRMEEIQNYLMKDPSEHRFVLLKDVVARNKDRFNDLGDDWGTA